MDTVVLPANRIERASRVMALRYRVAWMVMLATAVLLLIAGVMTKLGTQSYMRDMSDSLTMFALLVVAPIAFVFLIRRRAKRLAWIGTQAAADPTILWLIDEYRILATDEFGTPRPELAFKITPVLRDELLGVASAALR